jgi:hypothetical protein
LTARRLLLEKGDAAAAIDFRHLYELLVSPKVIQKLNRLSRRLSATADMNEASDVDFYSFRQDSQFLKSKMPKSVEYSTNFEGSPLPKETVVIWAWNVEKSYPISCQDHKTELCNRPRSGDQNGLLEDSRGVKPGPNCAASRFVFCDNGDEGIVVKISPCCSSRSSSSNDCVRKLQVGCWYRC